MKANEDAKSKARSTPPLPKDEPVLVSYYNMVIDGLDFVYERAFSGDLEYVDRLKRLAASTVELAGSPETCSLISAAAAVRADALKEKIYAFSKSLDERMKILTEAAENGNDEGRKGLREIYDLLIEADTNFPFRLPKCLSKNL